MTWSPPQRAGWAGETLPWWSLAALLIDAVGSAPGTLTPGRCEHAMSVARPLPAPLADWLYLEDACSSESGPLDLIIGVGATGRSVLAGRSPALAVPHRYLKHPVWNGVLDFVRRWATPDDPMAWVERLWLEFDADGANGTAEEVPVPGVFLDLPPALAGSAGAHTRELTEALACVTGGTLPDEACESLRSILRRLPRTARVPYVGAFPSRSVKGARICLSGCPATELGTCLAGLGWQGDDRALREITDMLGRLWTGHPEAALATTHLDLAPEVQPRLGLEYAFGRRSQLRGALAEWSFLESLHGIGLLPASGLELCRLWPGSVRARLRHHLEDVALIRLVTHVKVVFEPPHPVRVKLYLAACVRSLHNGTNEASLGERP